MENKKTNTDTMLSDSINILKVDPETHQAVTDIVASTFKSAAAGNFNRSIDNPEVMEQLKNFHEQGVEQDNKTLLLTGIVSALGGLFGGAVAGDAGAAAGLSGGFSGAEAGVKLAGSLAENRRREEEIDELRRKKMGLFTAKDNFALAKFAQEEKKSNEVNAGKYISHADRVEDRGLRKEAKKSDTGLRIRDAVDSDSTVKAARGRLDAIDVALGQLKSNNPNFVESFKTLLAKGVSGDVGTLSDKDIERYGGNPAFIESLRQRIERVISGKWTEENAILFETGLRELKRLWIAKQQDRRDELAKQFQATSSNILDKKTIDIAAGASSTKTPTLKQIDEVLRKREAAAKAGAR